MDSGNGKAEEWIISFTTQLREQLPVGKYIVTHARTCLSFFSPYLREYDTQPPSALAPWYPTILPWVARGCSLFSRFAPKRWGGGGYLKVHKNVGSIIDWVRRINSYPLRLATKPLLVQRPGKGIQHPKPECHP